MPPRRARPVAGRYPVDAGTAELLEVAPDRWVLAVEDVPQSCVDLADPGHVEFPYVRLLADVVDLAADPGTPLAAVHLGGGAATLARYTAATRPGSPQVVVEADAALATLVRAHLGTAGFRLRVDDARAALARLDEGRADLVVLDAFRGSAVPPHLTTVEHVDAVRRVLAPGGTYAVNVADGVGLAFARRQAATLGARWDEVALLAEPAVLRGRRFGNVVLVASDAPLPLAGLRTRTQARGVAPVQVLAGAALVRWCGGAAPVRDAAAGPSPVPPPGTFTLHR